MTPTCRLAIIFFNCLSFIGATTAWATPPSATENIHPELENAEVEVIRGFYYISSSRPEYAVDIAVRILQLDPEMISAHRVYIYGLLDMRQGDRALSIYQNWLQLSPDDEVRKTVLAWAWLARQFEAGPWCDEVDVLTRSTEVQDGAVAYWQSRARLEASKLCYFDGMASRDALIQIGKTVEEAWGYRLRLTLENQVEIDKELSAEIVSFATAFPNRMAYVPNLWASRYKGSSLPSTLDTLIELARVSASNSDPVELQQAAYILGRAGLSEEEAAASARLLELDPGGMSRDLVRIQGNRGFFTTRTSDRATELEQSVQDLIHRHQRRELLRALRSIDPDLPRTGTARAEWHAARAAAEYELGRSNEALESLRQAWLSEPDDSVAKGVAANNYAWAAALRETDLERALEAIDSALANLPSWDPQETDFKGRNYEEWLDRQRRRTGAWLDTKGWILYRMGQLEESLNCLQQAELMRPEPSAELILHQGLVQAALGNDEEALHLISRGLSLASPEDPLAIEAREIAENLFLHRRWSGSGLDGWIEAHKPEQTIRIGDTDPNENYRIGKTFPDLEVQISGKAQRLSELEGTLVIDLWASWCAPCMKALPHINDLAEAYEGTGITIVAVSVDRERADARRALKSLDTPQFVSAWAGREAMDQAHVKSIPSVFIVDENLEILSYFNGYTDGDTRIEDKLDALLEKKAQSLEERP